MLLRSSVKETISHVADSVLLGRDSKRDPDRYLANLIHDSDDNNSNNNVDDLTNLGDVSLYLFLDVVQNAAKFKTNSFLLIIY